MIANVPPSQEELFGPTSPLCVLPICYPIYGIDLFGENNEEKWLQRSRLHGISNGISCGMADGEGEGSRNPGMGHGDPYGGACLNGAGNGYGNPAGRGFGPRGGWMEAWPTWLRDRYNLDRPER